MMKTKLERKLERKLKSLVSQLKAAHRLTVETCDGQQFPFKAKIGGVSNNGDSIIVGYYNDERGPLEWEVIVSEDNLKNARVVGDALEITDDSGEKMLWRMYPEVDAIVPKQDW